MAIFAFKVSQFSVLYSTLESIVLRFIGNQSEQVKRTVSQVSVSGRTNNLYCLNDLRKRLREKKKRKRRGGERKQSVERGGDDASGHEASLVMAVTEKEADNRDYNYSFQHIVKNNGTYLGCLRVMRYDLVIIATLDTRV